MYRIKLAFTKPTRVIKRGNLKSITWARSTSRCSSIQKKPQSGIYLI